MASGVHSTGGVPAAVAVAAVLDLADGAAKGGVAEAGAPENPRLWMKGGVTTGIAIAFFLTSFGLAYFAKEESTAARDIGIPVVEEIVQEVPAEMVGELPAFEDASDSEIPEN